MLEIINALAGWGILSKLRKMFCRGNRGIRGILGFHFNITFFFLKKKYISELLFIPLFPCFPCKNRKIRIISNLRDPALEKIAYREKSACRGICRGIQIPLFSSAIIFEGYSVRLRQQFDQDLWGKYKQNNASPSHQDKNKSNV